MYTNLGKIKLYYFPVRGDAHRIRLLLAEAEIPYSDITILPQEYNSTKASLPCGMLPALEHGKLQLSGTTTIMRYLGKIGKMNGSTRDEKALVDMWSEYIDQVQQIEDRLRIVSNHLSKMEQPLLVGNRFTRADITLFSMLDSLSREMPSSFEKFPLLAAAYSRTCLRPQIEKFLGQEYRR
eukprot:Phypoly_transcript_20368.p1 GENE.Phypoly_transcript_20368~~Phypoly_transcript_20368.p1  ORF type:complete len:181 (+),score=7.03 Phypoly_transcript_20368:41-583(+)